MTITQSTSNTIPLTEYPTPVAILLSGALDTSLPFTERFYNLLSTVQQVLRFSGIAMISEYLARPVGRTRTELTHTFADLRTPTFGTWAYLLKHFADNLTNGELQEMPLTRALVDAYRTSHSKVKKLIHVRNERYGHRNLALKEGEAQQLYEDYEAIMMDVLSSFSALRNCALYFTDRAEVVLLCAGPVPKPVVLLQKDRLELETAFEAGPFALWYRHSKQQSLVMLYPFFECEMRTDAGVSPILFDGWGHRTVLFMGEKTRKEYVEPYRQFHSFFLQHKVPFPDVPISEVSLPTLTGYANEMSRRNINDLLHVKYFDKSYIERQNSDGRIHSFITESTAPAILVHGRAGMGKTSLLCHTAALYLEHSRAAREMHHGTQIVEGRCCVFLNISARNKNEPLWELARRHMGLAGDPTHTDFASLINAWGRLIELENVAEPKLLFIIDALDEAADLPRLFEEVTAIVEAAGELNQQEHTRNAVKVILSTRTLDFQRVKETLSGHRGHNFYLFGKYTHENDWIELEPFTEDQSAQAFGKLAETLHSQTIDVSRVVWDNLPLQLRGLLREPLLMWIYLKTFTPHLRSIPMGNMGKSRLWEAFFAHALRDDSTEAPDQGTQISETLHRFFVDDLMSRCNKACTLEITPEIVLRLQKMAEQKRSMGKKVDVPLPLLESRGLLKRRELEDQETETFKVWYEFVHRSVAQFALCAHFKEKNTLDTDFLENQMTRIDTFPGLRGALMMLMTQQWQSGHLQWWSYALKRHVQPQWASLLADTLTSLLRNHLTLLHPDAFDSASDQMCLTWNMWISENWSDSSAAQSLILLGSRVLADRISGASCAYHLQIPLAERLLREEFIVTGQDLLKTSAAKAQLEFTQANAYKTMGESQRSIAILQRSTSAIADVVSDLDVADSDVAHASHQLGDNLRLLAELLHQTPDGRIQAKDCAVHALEIFRKLVLCHANHQHYLHSTVKCLAMVGNLHDDTGERDEAIRCRMECLAILKKILEEEPGNTLYQYSLASTYGSLSVLYKQMGHRDDALKWREKNLEIRERVAATDPQNVVYQNGLAATYGSLSVLHMEMGHREEALKWREKNLKIRERVAATDPQNVSYQNGLADMYGSLSVHHKEMGHREEALKWREKNLEIRERIASTDPKNIGYQNELATAYANLSVLHHEVGYREDALKWQYRRMEIAEQIAASDPKNLGYQNGLASTYASLSVLYGEIGHREDALKWQQKNLEIGERITSIDPQNMSYQNGLASTYARLSALHKAMGHREAALNWREKNLVIRERISSTDPQNIGYQNGLSSTYANLCILHHEMGHREDALKWQFKRMKILERIAATDPQNVGYQNGLASTYASLSILSKEMGHREEALKWREKNLEISQRIVETDPQIIGYQIMLASSYASLSVLHKEIGHREEALKWREKDLEISQRIVETDPQNIDYQIMLASSYASLSILHGEMGNREDELKWREKDLEIMERIAAIDPQNLFYQNGLANTYSQLGRLHQEIGHWEEALRWKNQHRRMAEDIVSKDPQNLSYQYSLARTYESLSFLHYAMWDREDALKWQLKCLEISEYIAVSDKQSLLYQSSLGKCYGNLGLRYLALDDREAALKYRLLGLDSAERMAATDPQNVLYQVDWATGLHRLAEIYILTGSLDAAQSCLERAVAIRTQICDQTEGKPSMEYLDRSADTWATYASYWRAVGDDQQEVSCLKKEADIRESILAMDTQYDRSRKGLTQCYPRLIALLQQQNSHTAAEACQEKLVLMGA